LFDVVLVIIISFATGLIEVNDEDNEEEDREDNGEDDDSLVPKR